MASQAQVGRLTAVVRAAAVIVDIGVLLHPRGGTGASRSIAAGLLAPDLRSPHLPRPRGRGVPRTDGAQWSFEVRSPVTVAGPRRIRTGFPSATGDTVTNGTRPGYVRRAM